MRMPSTRWMITLAAAALFALTLFVGDTQPAQAQFGISIGGFPFRFNLGHGYRGYRGGRRHRGSRGGQETAGGEDTAPKKGKDEKIVVSAGAPNAAEQKFALLKIGGTAITNDLATTKDVKEPGQSLPNERERDYTARIKDIIKRFTDAQDRDSNPGDVTAAAIEQSLDKSFKNARLELFGQFSTESWTSERLRVRILDLVNGRLGSLFRGNNKGNAPMAQLDALIQSAAEEVFARIFETSELLAANKSSSLFIQRLYQTHGSMVSDELRETADGIITKASLTALAPFEPVMLRDDKFGYAYRYRGQRIIFDCLSENVEDITKSETKIRTVDDIRRRVMKTSN